MISVPGEILALAAGVLGGYLIARAAARRPREPASVTVETVESDDHGTFERLIRSLPVAVVAVDGTGHVRLINHKASELFSVHPERADGRALIEAIPSIELERLMNGALGGSMTGGTVVVRGVEGEKTIGVTVLPDGERSRGALILAEDRTALADHERVRREFLADVSHELRTPISAIRLMVETIELSRDDPEALGMFLPKIASELERMTNLVEDLLELARNESSGVPLHRRSIDLRRLINEAVDGYLPRADALDIDLSIDPGSPLEAEVDPERVTQVIANLVDNALRHTRPGGHVRVAVEGRNGEASIQVSDDGVGIPFRDLPHVFERFYVVDRSRARGSSGTGLGLAIVKQIVEAHGGDVKADSELGSGATFTCILPLRREQR